MTCETFEDRLYDEDARTALLGRRPVPGDLVPHRAACPRCAAAWDDAAAVTSAAAELLTTQPSLSTRHRVVTALSREATRGRAFDWATGTWSVVAGAVAGGVVTATLSPTPVWQVTAFVVGAAYGAAAHAFASYSGERRVMPEIVGSILR